MSGDSETSETVARLATVASIVCDHSELKGLERVVSFLGEGGTLLDIRLDLEN